MKRFKKQKRNPKNRVTLKEFKKMNSVGLLLSFNRGFEEVRLFSDEIENEVGEFSISPILIHNHRMMTDCEKHIRCDVVGYDKKGNVISDIRCLVDIVVDVFDEEFVMLLERLQTKYGHTMSDYNSYQNEIFYDNIEEVCDWRIEEIINDNTKLGYPMISKDWKEYVNLKLVTEQMEYYFSSVVIEKLLGVELKGYEF